MSVEKVFWGNCTLLNSIRAWESAKDKALIQIMILKVSESLVHADNKIHMDTAF